VRAAVFAVVAIERMSMLMDYRHWFPQDSEVDDNSLVISLETSEAFRTTPLTPEGFLGRDISLPAHDSVLSKHLLQRLEALVRGGLGAQETLDILDRVRSQSE
jgi:hypothetical protein